MKFMLLMICRTVIAGISSRRLLQTITISFVRNTLLGRSFSSVARGDGLFLFICSFSETSYYCLVYFDFFSTFLVWVFGLITKTDDWIFVLRNRDTVIQHSKATSSFIPFHVFVFDFWFKNMSRVSHAPP